MKKSEITKRLIIDSAIKQMQLNSNFTFKDISDDCGVNVASINYHFGTKAHLIDVILEECTQGFTELITNAIKHSDDNPSITPFEIAYDVINSIYDFMHQNEGLIRFVCNNPDILYGVAKKYVAMLSSDSPLAASIMETISKTSGITDKQRLVTKYDLAISSLAFPIVININLAGFDKKDAIAPMKGTTRELYIQELMNMLLQN